MIPKIENKHPPLRILLKASTFLRRSLALFRKKAIQKRTKKRTVHQVCDSPREVESRRTVWVNHLAISNIRNVGVVMNPGPGKREDFENTHSYKSCDSQGRGRVYRHNPRRDYEDITRVCSNGLQEKRSGNRNIALRQYGVPGALMERKERKERRIGEWDDNRHHSF
ncbi:hypothetical protein M413DRAFT_12526 [Hebeloma cylindrosporum]|uniref:Uncharacterized protein n=1 Tax=Hebeloma cylindrosporum TaxID=76867 RepID=A0A0C2YD03_HEBCY|nr:hypothetical protein M413DRAFT_12526 [Hebeloma cylindrosporum h7]